MMGIAMAAIASFFMDTADQKMEAIKDAIRKPVVADELAMMAAWYVVVCMPHVSV